MIYNNDFLIKLQKSSQTIDFLTAKCYYYFRDILVNFDLVHLYNINIIVFLWIYYKCIWSFLRFQDHSSLSGKSIQ